MSDLNVNEFKRLLNAKHVELSSAAGNRDDILIEAAADDMDRLQQHLTREVAIRSLDQASRLMKSVEAALDRIQGETYGICLRCEEPIAEKRLKALPWASHCVGCQEVIDRDHALSQDDSDPIAFAA